MSTQNILLTHEKMFCSISGQMKCFIWQDRKQHFSFSSYCARSRLWKAPSLRNKSQNGAFFSFFLKKKSFFKARSACQDDCLMGTHTCPCPSSPWTAIKPPAWTCLVPEAAPGVPPYLSCSLDGEWDGHGCQVLPCHSRERPRQPWHPPTIPWPLQCPVTDVF